MATKTWWSNKSVESFPVVSMCVCVSGINGVGNWATIDVMSLYTIQQIYMYHFILSC